MDLRGTNELNLKWYTRDAITTLKNSGGGGVKYKGFTDDQMNQIITLLKNDSKSLFGRYFTEDEVMIVLCVCCQKFGSTADTAQWKVSVLKKTKYISTRTIKDYLTKKCGFPTRPSVFKTLQITIPNEIFVTAKWLNIPGNLSNLVEKFDHPDDRFWMSDFQAQNDQCPGSIRFKIKKILDDKRVNHLRNKLNSS